MSMNFRGVQKKDLNEVVELIQRLGLEQGYFKEQVIRLWQEYSENNPFFDSDKFNYGWVLEDNHKIVGFFGNVIRDFQFEGRVYKVSAASTWAVEKQYRNMVPKFCDEYFTQENVDIFVGTTATLPIERIFARYDGKAIPDSSYDQVLYWILDAGEFLAAGLRKKGVPGALVQFTNIFSAAFSPIFTKVLDCTYGIPKIVSNLVKSIASQQLDQRFDDLWHRKVHNDRRLMAYRDRRALNWYMRLMSVKNRPLAFYYEDENAIRGFLLINVLENKSKSLKRARIVDIFIEHDDLGILDQLFAGVYLYCKALGVCVLELSGMRPEFRMHMLKYRPFKRVFPSFPYFYRTRSASLKQKLGKLYNWYPSILDGDSLL